MERPVLNLDAIYKAMIQKNLGIPALAEKTGLTRHRVARIMRGRPPRIIEIHSILTNLGLMDRVKELVTMKDLPQRNNHI